MSRFESNCKIGIFRVFAKNCKVGNLFKKSRLRKLRKIARLTIFRVSCDFSQFSAVICSHLKLEDAKPDKIMIKIKLFVKMFPVNYTCQQC